MKTGLWSIAVLVGVLLMQSTVVSASRSVKQDDARELVREGKIRPLSELMALHPGRLEGHLLDVELEYEDDVLVYEIEVLGADGVVREFYLDAASGAVLKEKVED